MDSSRFICFSVPSVKEPDSQNFVSVVTIISPRLLGSLFHFLTLIKPLGWTVIREEPLCRRITESGFHVVTLLRLKMTFKSLKAPKPEPITSCPQVIKTGRSVGLKVDQQGSV